MTIFYSFLNLLFPSLVVANSGRTNSKGCHTNRKTGKYHCQNKTPFANQNSTQTHYKESVYQKVWCLRNSGQVEVALQDKTGAARVLMPYDGHKKKR
ncbi:MAG: YHYH domain-containing protein [Nitrospinae bacterium]|nr:YHYH domain-containing protein [Nitrospinota bacterium]